MHCLVSEGGLDSEGQWRTPKRAAFVWPAKALMPLFRGQLRPRFSNFSKPGNFDCPRK
ncbi:MAG: hypothetical protein GKR94_28530 [Gammaproteobacteria bacterium]|nr:hypothetical protein [Gammaproteobacteria bacterium]